MGEGTPGSGVYTIAADALNELQKALLNPQTGRFPDYLPRGGASTEQEHRRKRPEHIGECIIDNSATEFDDPLKECNPVDFLRAHYQGLAHAAAVSSGVYRHERLFHQGNLCESALNPRFTIDPAFDGN